MKIRKFAGIGYKNMTATGGRTSLKISSVQDPYYKRFDTIGLNYRMPQIVASVCYSQLSSVKFIVNRRIQVANLFRKAIKNCKWIIEQKNNFPGCDISITKNELNSEHCLPGHRKLFLKFNRESSNPLSLFFLGSRTNGEKYVRPLGLLDSMMSINGDYNRQI